ncbi:MAG: tandem-95 repeat protein, partial [Candidatus Thorarchaeota archaeon]
MRMLNIPAPGLLENDYDIEGDFIFVDDWSDPGIGYLWVDEDGSFTFIPDPDWYGVVTFEYWVFDGLDHSNVVTVTIFVNSVNDAPIANDDAYTTTEDTLLRVLLLGVIENDFDADGDPLMIATVLDPSHGLLTMYPNGSFTYLPNPNWFGIDTFEYAITDGTADSNFAIVTIEVLPVNDVPVAVNDYVVMDEDTVVIIDVLANDYDVDGDPIDVL